MPIRTDPLTKYFLCEPCAVANPQPLKRHGAALRDGMHCPRCNGDNPAYWMLAGVEIEDDDDLGDAMEGADEAFL